MESLCTDLNMPAPMTPNTYTSLLEKVTEAAEKQAEASMKSASDEVHHDSSKMKEAVIPCAAMFDGTWRKRGHSSLQGVVTCISASTGKALDYAVMNKVCRGCILLEQKKDSVSVSD